MIDYVQRNKPINIASPNIKIDNYDEVFSLIEIIEQLVSPLQISIYVSDN